MIEALFAFAIQAAGYTEFCQQQSCPIPAVVEVEQSEHVQQDRAGWYAQGAAYVKSNRSDLAKEIVIVHELTHHLQRLSGRYHQYRGICNQYGAEREAYLASEAYANSKGHTTKPQASIDRYRAKCEAAIAAGLAKKPD